MTQAEADVRAHCHDIVNAHHDKDYRCFQAFPAAVLETEVVHVWRVSHWGQLSIDVLRGAKSDPSRPPLAVLIHRRHMRALRPPDS
eukprot:1752426-Heterocapsa_arctica.AAC.1